MKNMFTRGPSKITYVKDYYYVCLGIPMYKLSYGFEPKGLFLGFTELPLEFSLARRFKDNIQ